MGTRGIKLILMVMVAFFLVPSMVLATPIVNRLEIRDLGTQNGFGSYVNPDGTIDRSVISDFDPNSPQYLLGGDFTDTWINADNIGNSSMARLNFTVPGFTFSEIVSASFQVNFAGFDTANRSPRMGVNDVVGGNVSHPYALSPDLSGGYATQSISIDLDRLIGTTTARALLGEDFATFSLNFLKWDGFGGEGVIDNIQVVAWGNNGGTGVAPVPEPATILLFGVGLLGLAGASRKKCGKNV